MRHELPDLKGAPWTESEDDTLVRLQAKHGNRWAAVADEFPGRTGQQCAQRWRHKVNPSIRKDKWTEDEDVLLHALVEKLGTRWAHIAESIPGRTDQQCMGRWRRHLDPKVKRDAWSTKEDRALAELKHQHGTNWSAISKSLSNRTAQQCRARWFQAHFTGRAYFVDDVDGGDAAGSAALRPAKRRDAIEREIDAAKRAAAAIGKTHRPNGAKALKEKSKSKSSSPASSPASSGGSVGKRKRETTTTTTTTATAPAPAPLVVESSSAPEPQSALATPAFALGDGVATSPPPLRTKPPPRPMGIARQVSLPVEIGEALRGASSGGRGGGRGGGGGGFLRRRSSGALPPHVLEAITESAALTAPSACAGPTIGSPLTSLNSGDWTAMLASIPSITAADVAAFAEMLPAPPGNLGAGAAAAGAAPPPAMSMSMSMSTRREGGVRAGGLARQDSLLSV